MTLPLPVPIEQFRANLAHFVGRVVYGKERIVVQRYNRDAVVVLSAEEYQHLANPDSLGRWKAQEQMGLKRMYGNLMKLQGLGSKDVRDGSTTIDEVLYGEHGAWRGSAHHEE